MFISRIEEAKKKRRKMLFGNLILYFSWAGYFAYISLPIPDSNFKDTIDIIFIITLFLNTIYSVKTMSIAFELMKKNKVNRAINDELYNLNRLKALKYSFIFVLIVQAIIFYSLQYFPLTASNIISINIFLMLVTPMIAELILDRDEKEELIDE